MKSWLPISSSSHKWLTAEGAEGRATHTHPDKVTITLKRGGKETTVVCNGQRPEPYAALLHEINSMAIQERRIYLHDYVRGEAARDAWATIGREIVTLQKSDPRKNKLPLNIDHSRYLDIATRMVSSFYGRQDHELTAASRGCC